MQRREARRLRGAPGQGVLDDAVLDVAASELAAQVLDLADLEPAVIGEHRDLRLLQFLGQKSTCSTFCSFRAFGK